MVANLNRAFRDMYILTNSEQVGAKERTKNKSNYHPLIGADWETADKIRGLLGTYKTVYRGSKGPATYNYAAALNQIREGHLPGAYEGGRGGIKRLRNQLTGPNGGTNIVFDYSVVPGKMTQFLVLSYGLQEQSAWNSYANRSPSSTEFLSSVNSTREYLHGTYNVGNNSYEGLLNGLINVSLYDHASTFYAASSDLDTRLAGGYNLGVEPVYNYYASTTPPYETTIGVGGYGRRPATNKRIKEYHLPNVYYLQSELNNTGSVLLAEYHLPALTLDQNIEWFNVANQQNVTELNVDRYYDLYAEGIAGLLGDSAVYESVDQVLKQNNRNFVVLHTDIDALKEDRINATTIPFYNKITIGYDAYAKTGKEVNVSILRELCADPETKDFVDMLQMQVAMKLAGDTPTRKMGFMKTHKKVNSSTDASDYTFTSTDRPVGSLYDLEELFETLMTDNQDVRIASIINNFSNGVDPLSADIEVDLSTLPFRMIRDYNLSKEQLDVDPVQVENAHIDLYEDTASSANLARVTRTYEEILAGVTAHTETLMYVVKKKHAPTGPAIQTFYISAELANDRPTVFYDTQVKYGTNYHYDIDRVVLVFGNEYKYAAPPIVTQGTNILGLPIKSKIEITNKPNVKILLLPYVDGTGIQALITDKPPVPPEIRFYPLKGINNKIKILLNSSTGKMTVPPVSIAEADQQYFLEEYRTQTGQWHASYEDMISSDGKISFRSDDPVDAYELFRLDRRPQSYRSFQGESILINPVRGIPGSITDPVVPNKKYYYCVRAIDMHNNMSNPTHIYEIELVDNNGQMFLNQNVLRVQQPKEDFMKEGRRFLFIEPSFRQVVYDDYFDDNYAGIPAITSAPLSNILGNIEVDKVWGKSFKIRLTSKQTGRKVDLNLTFKNSGIVNASE